MDIHSLISQYSNHLQLELTHTIKINPKTTIYQLQSNALSFTYILTDQSFTIVNESLFKNKILHLYPPILDIIAIHPINSSTTFAQLSHFHSNHHSYQLQFPIKFTHFLAKLLFYHKITHIDPALIVYHSKINQFQLIPLKTDNQVSLFDLIPTKQTYIPFSYYSINSALYQKKTLQNILNDASNPHLKLLLPSLNYMKTLTLIDQVRNYLKKANSYSIDKKIKEELFPHLENSKDCILIKDRDTNSYMVLRGNQDIFTEIKLIYPTIKKKHQSAILFKGKYKISSKSKLLTVNSPWTTGEKFISGRGEYYYSPHLKFEGIIENNLFQADQTVTFDNQLIGTLLFKQGILLNVLEPLSIQDMDNVASLNHFKVSKITDQIFQFLPQKADSKIIEIDDSVKLSEFKEIIDGIINKFSISIISIEAFLNINMFLLNFKKEKQRGIVLEYYEKSKDQQTLTILFNEKQIPLDQEPIYLMSKSKQQYPIIQIVQIIIINSYKKLNQTDLTDISLQRMTDYKNVIQLDLSFCVLLSDQGFKQFIKKSNQFLQSLNISHTLLSDGSLMEIAYTNKQDIFSQIFNYKFHSKSEYFILHKFYRRRHSQLLEFQEHVQIIIFKLLIFFYYFQRYFQQLIK